MTQGRPFGEDGRGAETPSTWVVEPMSTNTLSAENAADTTDEPTAETLYARRDGALVPVAEHIPEECRLDDFEDLIFGDKLRYVGDRDVRQLGHELTFRSISMYGATLSLGTAFNGLLYLDPADYPPRDFVEVESE